MKLLFDESLSPRLVELLWDLFPESESALRNGLARTGDRKILEYAAAHDFVLVSTDNDFERLFKQIFGAKVVILRSCDYPTEIAAGVLRRNAIRIAELPNSQDPLIVLDRSSTATRRPPIGFSLAPFAGHGTYSELRCPETPSTPSRGFNVYVSRSRPNQGHLVRK